MANPSRNAVLALLVGLLPLLACAGSNVGSRRGTQNAGRVAEATASAVADAAASASLSAEPAADTFDWLEQPTERTHAWEASQNRKTSEYFSSSQTYADLLPRVHRYWQLPRAADSLDVRGKDFFALRSATDSTATILRYNGSDPPVALFRISPEDAARRMHVDFYSVSPRGRYIAVGTSVGGKEYTVVRVLDAHTGKDLGDRSIDTHLGILTWYVDDSGYLYMRGRGENVAEVDRGRDFSIAEHMIGTPPEKDRELVGSRAPGERLSADYDYTFPQTSLDGHWIVAEIHHGTTPNGAIYVARHEPGSGKNPVWTRVYSDDDGTVYNFAANGKLITIRHAGSESVVEETPFSDPKKRKVLLRSTRSLESLFQVGRSLFAMAVDQTGRHVVRLHDGVVDPVTPAEASVAETYNVDWLGRSAVLVLQSWTRPGMWVTLDESGSLQRVAVEPEVGLDDPFELWELDAPARDGETVHLVIIGPRGDRKPKYLWLRAYGAYGVTLGATFDAARRAFLDMGGAYVAAQIRGGGERGPSWHDAGRGANKIKTVEDTIDVVRFLRARGFGTGGGIFLCGGSAGGVPLGGLMVREPGLVDGVAILSGIVNVSRLEATSAAGPAQRVEFGSAATPEGARLLRDIDVFETARPAAYPPVMLISAADDYRVPYWQSTKLAARLQKYTTSDAPVLLQVTSGGHVGGRKDDEAETIAAEVATFAVTAVHLTRN